MSNVHVFQSKDKAKRWNFFKWPSFHGTEKSQAIKVWWLNELAFID